MKHLQYIKSHRNNQFQSFTNTNTNPLTKTENIYSYYVIRNHSNRLSSNHNNTNNDNNNLMRNYKQYQLYSKTRNSKLNPSPNGNLGTTNNPLLLSQTRKILSFTHHKTYSMLIKSEKLSKTKTIIKSRNNDLSSFINSFNQLKMKNEQKRRLNKIETMKKDFYTYNPYLKENIKPELIQNNNMKSIEKEVNILVNKHSNGVVHECYDIPNILQDNSFQKTLETLNANNHDNIYDYMSPRSVNELKELNDDLVLCDNDNHKQNDNDANHKTYKNSQHEMVYNQDMIYHSNSTAYKIYPSNVVRYNFDSKFKLVFQALKKKH